MKITARQRHLLSNLDRITVRRKASGRLGFFLVREDFTTTINSLLVRRVLVREPNGRSLALAKGIDPLSVGVFAT